MRSALFVFTLALALTLTLACGTAAPEEQATSSETNQTANNAQQTPEPEQQEEKLSKEEEKEMHRRENGAYCNGVFSYLSQMDRQLYELMADANADLEIPINVQLMKQQAMFAVEAGERTPSQVPQDAKKLGRSVEKYHEKVTEFHGDLDQASAKKIHRSLGNLVDDFVDLHGDFEGFCEPYLH